MHLFSVRPLSLHVLPLCLAKTRSWICKTIPSPKVVWKTLRSRRPFTLLLPLQALRRAVVQVRLVVHHPPPPPGDDLPAVKPRSMSVRPIGTFRPGPPRRSISIFGREWELPGVRRMQMGRVRKSIVRQFPLHPIPPPINRPQTVVTTKNPKKMDTTPRRLVHRRNRDC